MSDYHIPVMLDEVLQGLEIKPDAWYLDATVGGGGHSEAVLKTGGRVMGLDQDGEAIAETGKRLEPYIKSGRLQLVQANFRDVAEVAEQQKWPKMSGIVMDLGVSSHQLDDPGRGFSFDSDTLDMRMDERQSAKATDLLAQLPERDLATLFSDLGEERYARSFARAIVTSRSQQPIISGQQLAELLKAASPKAYRYGHIHPATRVFQALRLAVNDEMNTLKQALPAMVEVLDTGGILAVISFHSLEDRIVKHVFQQTSSLHILTKTPMCPTAKEIAENPRSRSAKLRLAKKL